MLYVVHDFFMNFMAFVNANDTIMLDDLMMDEIAKIVIFDRGKIIEAIKKIEPKTSDNISDDQIVKFIINNGKNDAFIIQLTSIIVINNSEGHTLTSAHTQNVKTALLKFLNKNNASLLSSKIKQHRKLKDMVFGTGDEAILAYNKKKNIKKIVLITTAVVITTTVLIFSFKFYRKVKSKKTATVSTSETPKTA